MAREDRVREDALCIFGVPWSKCKRVDKFRGCCLPTKLAPTTISMFAVNAVSTGCSFVVRRCGLGMVGEVKFVCQQSVVAE